MIGVFTDLAPGWRLAALGGLWWALMAVVMLVLWLRQRRTRNASWVDVAWAFGTGGAGAWLALAGPGAAGRGVLVAALALAWGVRLGTHLAKRVGGDDEEDRRYAELRRIWGDAADRNFLLFFQVQAFWTVLFAVPMTAAASNPAPFPSWLDALAVAIALVAVGGEWLADRQLARFRARAKREGLENPICRDGLWGWSRHPNYFFEWIGWFAWVPMALAAEDGVRTVGLVALAGPALMLWFLLKVTGVPPVERRMLASRGDAFRRYQRETSVFIPLPPRRGRDASTEASGDAA